MSKKSKKNNTPSAKAARNLEALKKAKEAAVAEETKAAQEAPVEKADAQKEEKIVEKPIEKKEEKKEDIGAYKTPVGKTSYDTHMLCRKSPFMSPISRSLYKDDKGIEQIKETWKNTNDNSVVTVIFPLSHIKDNDDMYTKEDLAKLRGEESKEEKKEVKKEPKQKVKKEKKEEVIEEAEIIESAPTVKTNNNQIPQMTSNAEDRIDANHSVDLLNCVLRRQESIKNDSSLKELHKALGMQSDLMLGVLLSKWNHQLQGDAESVGIKVNKEMFNYLEGVVAQFFSTKLIGATTKDGQMTIDFSATEKTMPAETQKALKQDAAVVKTETTNVEDLPRPEECADDDAKINAIRTISMARFGKGTMGKNLINVIEFSRKAWGFDDKAEPAMILATVLKKMEAKGQATTLLNCMSSAVIGNLTNNFTAISAHTWMKGMLPSYTDSQIANIVKVLIVKRLEEGVNDSNNFNSVVKPYNILLSNTTDDLINRIIASSKNSGKDDDKLKVPKIPSLLNEPNHIVSIKLMNSFKAAYGPEMSDKLISTQMKRINMLYKTFNPLAFYTEKSAYKK